MSDAGPRDDEETPSQPTTRTDTVLAAKSLVTAGVDCIVFAGGDGTATDIAEAIGLAVPVIGVPSGVKMHSEIFASSPERAGTLLSQFLRGEGRLETVEVLDAGSEGTTRAVNNLLAPVARDLLQRAKAGGGLADSGPARRAIARDLLANSSGDETWVLGPGTTSAAIADALGFSSTLRGVDVRYPSGETELDVDEDRLFEIAGTSQVRLVLGVVGGQGFLLGRGNHEVSTRIIESIGTDSVIVVATEEKIGGLFPPVLLVDVGDDEAEHPLEGYRKVLTGGGQSTVLKVVNAAQ